MSAPANEVRDRLLRCFAAVFPSVPPGELETASPVSVEAWDSLANATLLTVVEQEFGVEIPPDDLDELVSFEAIAEYLERRA